MNGTMMRFAGSIALIVVLVLAVQGRHTMSKSNHRCISHTKHLNLVMEQMKQECEERPKMKYIPVTELIVLRQKLEDMGKITKIGYVRPEGTYVARCDSIPSCYSNSHKKCTDKHPEVVTLEFAITDDYTNKLEIFKVDLKNHTTCTCS